MPRQSQARCEREAASSRVGRATRLLCDSVGTKSIVLRDVDRDPLVASVIALIEAARAAAARSVNTVMTTTYWRVGQAIVEREQGGARRAEYGGALLARLASALTARYGRGFSRRNLEQMRAFYLAWANPQAVPAFSSRAPNTQTPSALSSTISFPLPQLHRALSHPTNWWSASHRERRAAE